MAEGASLATQLAAAAQPLLKQFGSQAEAARALADHAPQIAARNFSTQHSAVAVSQLVMQQAEVPERVSADREFGASFVYDAQLFGRRLGGVLVQQLDQMQGLSGWLGAVSVAASLEDARLAATTALKALLTAAHKHRLTPLASSSSAGAGGSSRAGAAEGGRGVTAEAVQSALSTLADALADVAAYASMESASRVQAAAAEAAAVDALGVHLSNAGEAAYVLLLMAQQWGSSAAAAADEAAATALCSAMLRAAGDWLEALERTSVASLSGSPDAQPAADSITHSLLAAALVLLPTAPAVNEAVHVLTAQQQRLQEGATQLLPQLLAACHRQPPQLVLVVSLATALIDRLVPPAAWLPLLRTHLHFGDLLHSMLLSLHSTAQQAVQQRAAATAAAAATSKAVLPRALLPPALPPVPTAMLSAPGGPAGAAPAGPAGWLGDAQQLAILSPLAAVSVEEAALLLALQVAQSRSGAELLLEQGAVAHALALGKWLLIPEGGNLMGETPLAGGGGLCSAGASSLPPGPPAGASGVVDYSNAYRQDGSPNPAHRLWCCMLSLMAVLLAALPGHAAVEEAALQLAVDAEPRLLLAAEPPAASPQQPLSLAMAQETKYSLFFLCGLARLSGQWRIMLPHSLPAFRRATASFLDFAGAPGAGALSCAPVTSAERAAARLDAALDSSSSEGSRGASGRSTAPELAKGWFGAVAANANAAVLAGRQAGAARTPGGYAWQLAERLYSSAQYALSFQLALAPEVAEEELPDLGPEWVRPDTLLAIQEDALDVADSLPVDARALPAVRRLARTLQALLGLTSQMQDGMGAQRTHAHKQAVAKMMGRLEATASSRAG